MARETLTIGSTPNAEDCAQVGSENYTERSRKECQAYINQLTRIYGEPPFGARYKISSNPHDFGTYHEVDIVFDDQNEAAEEYAYKVELGCENWDDEARKELGLDAEASAPRELSLDEMNIDEHEIIEYSFASVVPACCSEGCEVEPDGKCQHGFPSILIKYGII